MGKVLLHIIPAISIGFIIQILIHEIGHLLGGLLTGWKLLFIQIYRLLLKRTEKRLKVLVVKDKGFKCIMYPKSIKAKALLYTMGGCIINLMTGLIGLIILIMAPMSPITWLYLWCFSVFGIGLYIMNGTSSIKRVCNDKASYKLLKSDENTKAIHNIQLMAAKYLIKGYTYMDIGEEFICKCPKVAKNDIEAYQAVLEYYYYLDTENHLGMGQALNKIRDRKNISKEVLDSIDMEFIYIRLLCAIKLKKDLSNDISTLENTNKKAKSLTIKTHLEDFNRYGKKDDVHLLRVKAVYEAYICFMAGNKDKAINKLNESIKLMETYSFVYEGEKKFCLKQLNKIKKLITNQTEDREKDRRLAL